MTAAEHYLKRNFYFPDLIVVSFDVLPSSSCRPRGIPPSSPHGDVLASAVVSGDLDASLTSRWYLRQPISDSHAITWLILPSVWSPFNSSYPVQLISTFWLKQKKNIGNNSGIFTGFGERYEVRAGVVCLQVKLCVSALEVRFSRRGAIKIYVYLYLYMINIFWMWNGLWLEVDFQDRCVLVSEQYTLSLSCGTAFNFAHWIQLIFHRISLIYLTDF